MVEVGELAPDFTLPGVCDGQRRDFTLSEYRGRKVVLAFYPGDNTPGCTRQMCSYRDDFSKFDESGAVLLGISPQDVDSHESWAAKRGFHFPLLADTAKLVIDLYGVRGGKLIAVKRSVFVVGADGVVAFVDRKVVGATFVSADKLVPVLAKL
jgi:thioredoxin-dependent peroxiredoxin